MAQAYSGITVSKTAGETLAFGDPVYAKSDGKVWKADALDVAKMPAVGIVVVGGIANATVQMLVYGTIKDTLAWTWTIGEVLRVADGGGIATTVPTGASSAVRRVLQPIGVAGPIGTVIELLPFASFLPPDAWTFGKEGELTINPGVYGLGNNTDTLTIFDGTNAKIARFGRMSGPASIVLDPNGGFLDDVDAPSISYVTLNNGALQLGSDDDPAVVTIPQGLSDPAPAVVHEWQDWSGNSLFSVNGDGTLSLAGQPFMMVGSGSPVGVVVPLAVPILYYDLTNGGLYSAFGPTNVEWVALGGDTAGLAGNGVFVSNPGDPVNGSAGMFVASFGLSIAGTAVRPNGLIDTNGSSLTVDNLVDFDTDNGAVGFFNASPVSQPTLTGALSAVTDPAAKAVLQAIVDALSDTSGYGLTVDGTT